MVSAVRVQANLVELVARLHPLRLRQRTVVRTETGLWRSPLKAVPPSRLHSAILRLLAHIMLIKVSSKLTRLQPYSRGQARKFHERVRSSSRHVTGSSPRRVAGATRTSCETFDHLRSPCCCVRCEHRIADSCRVEMVSVSEIEEKLDARLVVPLNCIWRRLIHIDQFECGTTRRKAHRTHPRHTFTTRKDRTINLQ